MNDVCYVVMSTTPLQTPIRLRAMTHRIGNEGFDISPAPVDSNLWHPHSQRPPKSAKQLENGYRLKVKIKLEDEELQGKLGFKEERAEITQRAKIDAKKSQTTWRLAELQGNSRDALEAKQV